MATVHYTAKVKDSRTLELPEEAEALRLKPGDEVQVSVEQNGTSAPQASEGSNLADALKDYIGSFDFGDANLSEDTGRKFAELLVQKHRNGQL